MKDLIGKKFKGFRFNSRNGVSFVGSMERFVGKTGIVTDINESRDICTVVFSREVDEHQFHWNYPISEVMQHLIEEEEKEDVSIEQIIDNIKQLREKL
jgi:hypothetical protein